MNAVALSDWSLLSVVTVMQIVTAAAVRIFALRLVRAGATRAGSWVGKNARGNEARVVWAIEATGRRLGRLSTCLERAVVAEAILGSPATPVQFTIGIKRGDDGSLQAHAWVSRDDRVLIGSTADRYVRLVEWSDTAV